MSDQTDDFPILCETCLGPNPYIRMTKEGHSKACKVCDRPMTVYRWKPGAGARYKKTEICKTCSKLKNVCQTCVLDLQYGLPVQVRDSGLEEADQLKMPVSTTMRNYMYERLEDQMANESPGTAYNKVKRPNAMFHVLQRKGPYYERNRPHVCSFFVKGTCKRGSECPYRHPSNPEEIHGDKGALADQNIKDRFYGKNDPVADKLLDRYKKMKESENKIGRSGPPASDDPNLKTVYVGGVDATFTDGHVREHFAPFGPISDIHMAHSKYCCFVTFVNRADAENAINTLYDCLFIRGRKMKVFWGQGRTTRKTTSKLPPPGMKRKTNAAPAPGMRMPIRAQVPTNPLAGPGYASMNSDYGASYMKRDKPY